MPHLIKVWSFFSRSKFSFQLHFGISQKSKVAPQMLEIRGGIYKKNPLYFEHSDTEAYPRR